MKSNQLHEDRKKALKDIINGGLNRVAHIKENPDHKTQVLADTVANLGNYVVLLEEEMREKKARQEEINEEIYTILKCIVHSGDNYERGVVDLNTVAFLERLSKMIHFSGEKGEPNHDAGRESG